MRARGEGSLGIERRKGRQPRYVVRHSLPDGRRKARRFASRDEAVAWLRSMTPAKAATSTSSLADYLSAWLTDVRATVAPSTWRVYELTVRKWLAPKLGAKRLDRLTVADVRSYLHSLPLHPQTVSHHRAILRKALNDAKVDGLVERNVAELAKPPTVPKEERRWLSGEELRRLFESTQATRLHALWVLAGTTGLRSAELLALAWQDVDLDGAVLRVRHTLHRHAGEWVFRSTKTRQERSVPLTDYAVWALRQHHARQQQDAFEHGYAGPLTGLVFTSARGRPLHGANLSKLLAADLAAAGLPVVTPHALRHSAASFWLAEGVDVKVISDLLGHSDPRITQALYVHTSDLMKRDAVTRMQRALEEMG